MLLYKHLPFFVLFFAVYKIETPTKSGTNRMSPTLNQDSAFGDRQFMVITSEKQCRILALPSQNCVYRLQITETDFVVRAEIVSMKGKNIIVCHFNHHHHCCC